MKYRICFPFEVAFGWLEDFFRSLKERVSICKACGRNKYTGAACWDGLK